MKTLTEQVEILISRHLSIDDPARAAGFLYDMNYYRLSGYFRQFQVEPKSGRDDFHPGVTLRDVQEVHETDSECRRVLQRALGTVERTVRARFAYELAVTHGNTAFYNRPSTYVACGDKRDPDGEHVVALLRSIRSELERTHSVTLDRYRATDGSLHDLPIWVAIEFMSFGTVSRMLGLLRDRDPALRVAASFGERPSTFAQTLRSLVVLRNKCAHHAQLWHREMRDVATPFDMRLRRRQERVEFPDWGEVDEHSIAPTVLAIRRMLTSAGQLDCLAVLDRFLATAADQYIEGLVRPEPR